MSARRDFCSRSKQIGGSTRKELREKGHHLGGATRDDEIVLFVFANRKARIPFVSRRARSPESDERSSEKIMRDGSIAESSCSLKLQLRGFRICHETFSSCLARSMLRKRGALFPRARVRLRFFSILDEDSSNRRLF